jgi:dTDP-L-rhamnose 4-epimerase
VFIAATALRRRRLVRFGGASTVQILVTGGAGFIGSHVVGALLEAGHGVRVLDALPATVHPRAPELDPRVELVLGDIRDSHTVERALDGVDLVNHQAAMVGLSPTFADAPFYTAINCHGTAVLLAAMTRAGVGRLVLASSVAVYGDGVYRCAEHGPTRVVARRAADLDQGRYEPPCPDCGQPLTPEFVTEDVPPDPRNVYAASKLAQEHLAAAWARAEGTAATALRYHTVYGPRMSRATPYTGVASQFQSALAAGQPPRIFEDGRQWRDFVHVADVAQANLRATELPVTPGRFEAYNIGSGVPRTVGDLAECLAEAHGGPAPLVTGEYRMDDVRHLTASSLLAGRRLGYRPTVGFEDGIRALATRWPRSVAPPPPASSRASPPLPLPPAAGGEPATGPGRTRPYPQAHASRRVSMSAHVLDVRNSSSGRRLAPMAPRGAGQVI